MTSAVPMTPLVAAVIVHDRDTDRVVVLRRGPHTRVAPLMWDLPGGKGDPGEPITRTAVRELHEETGLVVDEASLRVAHLIHLAPGGEQIPTGFLSVVFSTHTWTGTPRNVEPTKHTEVRWADRNALPEPFVAGSGGALRAYLDGGVDVSLYDWPEG